MRRVTVLLNVSERKVLDWTPPADNALIACLPVGVVSLDHEPRFDLEIQTGFVAEVDADAVVAKLCRELNGFNGLAFGLGKADELPEPARLLLGNGTFSFSLSHIRLLSGGLVRAASLLKQWRGPIHVIGGDSDGWQGKSDLPNNSTVCPTNTRKQSIFRQSHKSVAKIQQPGIGLRV
jgi:hypothetical protein